MVHHGSVRRDETGKDHVLDGKEGSGHNEYMSRNSNIPSCVSHLIEITDRPQYKHCGDDDGVCRPSLSRTVEAIALYGGVYFCFCAVHTLRRSALFWRWGYKCLDLVAHSEMLVQPARNHRFLGDTMAIN
jgi:hypothetical protein